MKTCRSRTIFLVLLVSLIWSACTNPTPEQASNTTQPSTMTPFQKRFVHHVFFYMKPEATEADRAALKAGIMTLTQIETIKEWHLGVPAPTDREVIDSGYAFSWLTTFEDGAAEEVYQKHPVHLEFIKNNAHLWSKVIVYDSI